MSHHPHGSPVNTGDSTVLSPGTPVRNQVEGERIVVVDDQHHAPPILRGRSQIQREKHDPTETTEPDREAASNGPSNKTKSRQRFQRLGNHLFRYRPTGLIYGVFRLDGKVVWRNLRTTDKGEARQALAQELKRSEQLDLGAARSLTLQGLIQFYDQTLNSYAPGTAENRRCLLGILKRTWPHGLHAKVADLSSLHLRTWLALHQRRLCHSTWNTYLRLLRALFDLAVEAKAVTDNPAAQIEPLRKETPVRFTPSWEQFQALVASVRAQKFNARSRHSADLIEFMGCCGLGQAECHNLHGEHFNFVRREITVFRQKTRRAFLIPMYPQALPLLERLRGQGQIRVGQLVFPWRTPEVALRHACQRLGYPCFSPRSLRRLFILRALERGIDPRVIAAWQGHVDGGTLVLRVYGAFIGADHAQRMAALLV